MRYYALLSVVIQWRAGSDKAAEYTGASTRRAAVPLPALLLVPGIPGFRKAPSLQIAAIQPSRCTNIRACGCVSCDRDVPPIVETAAETE